MILVGHGGGSNREVVESLADRLGVSAAFVEGEPSLEDLVERTEGHVVVLPALLARGHTLRRIRSILEGSGASFEMGRPLMDHRGVEEALRDRLMEVRRQPEEF